MKTFEIIPAIDIVNGQCVRLEQGRFDKKTVYEADPLNQAKVFEDAGIKRLHLVDLDGAKAKSPQNLAVLEKIANKTKLIIDYGGGVQSDRDIMMIFSYGAAMVTAGSIAVNNPTLVSHWLERFGQHKIIIGVDVKGEQVATHAWTETSEQTWEELLSHYYLKGARKVISTDISKDGMLAGPSVGLYLAMKKKFPDLEIIASGGVTNLQDLIDLKGIGCSGAIIGKALYEGRISLLEIQQFNESQLV